MIIEMAIAGLAWAIGMAVSIWTFYDITFGYEWELGTTTYEQIKLTLTKRMKPRQVFGLFVFMPALVSLLAFIFALGVVRLVGLL